TVVLKGEVQHVALEDNRRRLQRRIDKLLGPLNPEWPEAFEYATEWPRANEGGLDKIREWILAKANPRLVIVDVLAMFKPVRGSSESLYEADYAAIKGLQGLASEHGVAICIVHHTRKSGTESDPFEKVSGTLGLSGAADTTLILDRDGNGATLYGRGRDVEEIESAVVFDKAGCRWHVQGEASDVRRTDERGAVLAALEDATEPMSPGEIADETRMSNQNIRQLLVKMVKAGEVVKVGRGQYRHPDHNPPPDHNNHKITKLSDYRPAKSGDGLSGAVSDRPVCDRDPVTNHKLTPSEERRDTACGTEVSASQTGCDHVIDVTGGSDVIAAPEDPVSKPARDFLKWLQSRPERPINAKLIPSHAPRHTRTPEIRGLVLASLEERGLVRIEERSNAGTRVSRFIYLTDGGANG
ncbi:AAA family ATPase, partial [Methylobacterium aerolatum]|uniref:AAA family ATPase n=1 Tax=Methylobacterium aerolatum TaxID=418708 RepID=UPI001EDF8AD6